MGVISSAVEQLAVNQKVDGSNPSLPLFYLELVLYFYIFLFLLIFEPITQR